MKRTLTSLAAVVLNSAPALAIDEAHEQRAQEMIDSAIAYLSSQQDESGAWSVGNGGRTFPAITGLVVNGMLMHPDIDADDERVSGAIEWIISMQKPDGGIHDGSLPSYNTAICVSALSRVDSEEAFDAVAKAVPFLKQLQYGPGAADRTARVSEKHPFYGGVGYGSHGRPDASNLSFFIDALHDADVPADDPAYQRAVVFMSRVQMDDRVNDMAYAEGSRQGGFIYATGPDEHRPGVGESKAGEVVESLDDGTEVSRLRAYGSMTYAGFKTYVYADLPKDDERVTLALDWIRRHYTLDENPGMEQAGLYYYFVTFSRSLDAWGTPTISTPSGDRDWANDLIDRLASLQNEDGSFRSVDGRWMENDPVLITAYALLALQHSLDR